MTAIKKRHIQVENVSCTGCEKELKTTLAGIDGIDQIHVDRKSGGIDIEYDLLKTNLKSIEQKINESGYVIHDNLLNRIKSRFIRFTEENERDSLNAPPMPCCSQPDKILKKGS